MISCLGDDLLTPNELDPLGLHLSGSSQVQYVPARLVHRVFSYDDAVIQIALISENSRLSFMHLSTWQLIYLSTHPFIHIICSYIYSLIRVSIHQITKYASYIWYPNTNC